MQRKAWRRSTFIIEVGSLEESRQMSTILKIARHDVRMVKGEKPAVKSSRVKSKVRLVYVLDRELFTGGLMFGRLFT